MYVCREVLLSTFLLRYHLLQEAFPDDISLQTLRALTPSPGLAWSSDQQHKRLPEAGIARHSDPGQSFGRWHRWVALSAVPERDLPTL